MAFFLVSMVAFPLASGGQKGSVGVATRASLPSIKSVKVLGNSHIGSDAILNRTNFRIGGLFDYEDASEAIGRILGLGYFSNVKIEKELLDDNKVAVFVTVSEKKLLAGYEFEGNSVITSKKLANKIDLSRRDAIDEADLDLMLSKIRKLYRKENYYGVRIRAQLHPDPINKDRVRVRFLIDEGKKTRVVVVNFIGCKCVPEYKVREIVFTREDWLGSFSDNAGQYDKDRLEADKKRIEMLYQDHGYLAAKVTDVRVEEFKDGKEIRVEFVIDEGILFTVRYVTLPADDEFPEHKFVRALLLKEGALYSRTKLYDSITRFQYVFGEKGYIDADVYPQLLPDPDNECVDIKFNVEKGNKFYVNRISVTGNKVTRDWVIRREITLEEGCLASRAGLEASKERVEYLGYFERDSVEWKKHRVGSNKVDLELNVKEGNTGSGTAGISLGGTSTSTATSLKLFADIRKRNFLGRGWDVGGKVQFGKLTFQQADCEFYNAYLNDSNISLGVNAYYDKSEYDQLTVRSDTYPLQRSCGASVRVGTVLTPFGSRVRAIAEFGLEDVSYDTDRKTRLWAEVSSDYKPLLQSQFQDSLLLWIGANLVEDQRNHRFNPSKGWKWELKTKMGLPSINSDHSIIKAEGNLSWYTPLISQDRLVLSLYGKAGIMASLDSEKTIPYKELYHIGGTGTVRGFKWGAAGPQWVERDGPIGARKKFYALGAQKMIVFNTELTVPVGNDDSAPRVYLFYDIGAGWNTPDELVEDKTYLRQDNFHLRHTVGIGLKLTVPYAVRIDWGYKLDRDRRFNETPLEMNISMNVPM